MLDVEPGRSARAAGIDTVRGRTDIVVADLVAGRRDAQTQVHAGGHRCGGSGGGGTEHVADDVVVYDGARVAVDEHPLITGEVVALEIVGDTVHVAPNQVARCRLAQPYPCAPAERGGTGCGEPEVVPGNPIALTG